MKKMKYCIAAIFAVLLLTAGNKALAAPICPVPREVTQPDGTKITVTTYGDEFFSWREDADGNIIAYDEATDSYKYAEIKDGKLVPALDMVEKGSRTRRAAKKLQREDILPLWENTERIDYSQTAEGDGVSLLSADEEPAQKKPLTHQKLLTLLIEFSDVKLKYDGEFWAKRMYSTNPKDISVVNYWKENANGLDVFEPADTSRVQDKITGVVSYEEFTDIGYTVTKCPEGVIKVSLDMPHPIKTWNNNYSEEYAAVSLALRAVESNMDFKKERIHLVSIFAGYNMPLGEGQGQILGNVSGAFMYTSDNISLGKFVVQGELSYDDTPGGIGITCHELGHAIFDLPDLYFNFVPNGGWTGNGLMYYSLMSTGCWGSLYSYKDHPSPNNIWNDPYAGYMYYVPTHLDPWCKTQCGFVTPTVVNEWDGDINSISEMGNDSEYNVLEIRSKAAANQYFLVENRQLIGYDAGLEAWDSARGSKRGFKGGIIIYHVDEGVFPDNNNNSYHHHFMQVEPSLFPDEDNHDLFWEFLNIEGRNKLNEDTTPNSNMHELITVGNWECSQFKDCHPQTLKSGISIEVLGDNGPSVRVKTDVEKDYRVSMVEGATLTDLFPDESFRCAVIDNMEEKDGVVRTADQVLTIQDWATLASIDDLQVESYGISDLTGIEYFPNLQVLNCRDNEISDLTPAQGLAIIDLDCGNNKLTEIELSNWLDLLYLYCDNNRIAELDISNNTQLDDLICSNNVLTALDTSQNPELYFLECENNKLASLDLTNNPRLRRLWCYRNSMDPETPGNSIKGLETLPKLGTPLWENDPNKNYFAYFPQNTNEREHSWEKVWQKDGTHHWHNCTDENCPVADNAKKDSYGVHVYDGNQDTTCNICGYVRAVTPPVPISPSSPSEPVEPDSPNSPVSCPRDENCILSRFVGTNQNAWYHDGVHYCLENDLMSGYGGGRFGPNDSLTRGMLAQILYSETGKPSVSGDSRFDDVASGAWYAKAVAWGTETGILSGYGNGNFGPADPITREQLAVMLWRYAGSPATQGTLNGFTDQRKVSRYATEAMRWAVEKGILSGKGNGILDPEGEATRAEAAVMLYRYFTLEE